MSGKKNLTLCMVWIFTRRSQGGRVRPRTLLSERVEIANHVLPHPKEFTGVLGGYQRPAMNSPKGQDRHLRSPGDQCDAG